MKVVATLRHHPQHLGFLVLAQTDRTRRVITITANTPSVLKLGVRINYILVEPNDGVFIVALVFVFILGDKDYARDNNTFFVDVVGVVVVAIVVVVLRAARARDTAAEVGGEEESRE